jgi:hypothetical protein
MGNLFQELKRRNVYKVATVYVVISVPRQPQLDIIT